MKHEYRKTREEIAQTLRDQISALEASAAGYDAGNKWESTRIATTVHTIVHDGGKNNKSLLTQLGMRPSLRFVSSGNDLMPGNIARETPLVRMQLRTFPDKPPEAAYVPHLKDNRKQPKFSQFPTWWDSELIFKDGDFKLTRKKLVFALRNNEGGSHSDEVLLNPSYIKLRNPGLTTPKLVTPSGAAPMLQAELATMRQIAWELAETLKAVEIR